jgi:EAL domain-containing protein (putative c-di-GMP-specific phosphodiesterase class I)
MLAFRLKKHNLKANQVALEIVESVSAKVMSQYADQLTRLKRMGFLIAADDFGSEHSNFSRLLSVDLDYVKIDGSFIRNLKSDGRSMIVVRNIVEFSRSIGAKTVAEHVSTPQIHEIVKELNINYSQGYLFGKPSPTITETVHSA